MNEQAAPPAVLDCAQRLAYAVVDSSVEFTGRCGMMVDGKALGPVSRLAICRNIPDGDILLLYCTDDWESVAAAGYGSVDLAKDGAERGYRGLSGKWVDAPSSDLEVSVYLEEHWPACSFCGKRAFEVESMVKGSNSRICDQCIVSLGLQLASSRQAT